MRRSGRYNITHYDVQSNNGPFDLAVHKIKQAIYFANVLTGRDKNRYIYRMSVTNTTAAKVSWVEVDAAQRDYLREFLGELDLWVDTLETFGHMEIGPRERQGVRALLQEAIG